MINPLRIFEPLEDLYRAIGNHPIIKIVERNEPYPFERQHLIEACLACTKYQKEAIHAGSERQFEKAESRLPRMIRNSSSGIKGDVEVDLFRGNGKNTVVITTGWPRMHIAYHHNDKLSVHAGDDIIQVGTKRREIANYELYILNAGAYKIDLKSTREGIIFDSAPGHRVKMTLARDIKLRTDNPTIISKGKTDQKKVMDYLEY